MIANSSPASTAEYTCTSTHSSLTISPRRISQQAVQKPCARRSERKARRILSYVEPLGECENEAAKFVQQPVSIDGIETFQYGP
jgi:hypothetical protein